jgi:PAS domain S-box-containing protein
MFDEMIDEPARITAGHEGESGGSHAAEDLFHAVFMAMDEGAILQDASGAVIAVNPATEAIFGFAAAELIGLSAADLARALGFVHEDGTSVPWKHHPAMLALQTATPQRHVVMAARRPDGTLRWLSGGSKPLLAAGEALPHAVLSTFRDITEHRRAGQERRAYARSLECMDRVNVAIQGSTDLEQIMNDVLDVVLAEFGCDRAFLVYPCDPTAAEWRVPMERTRAEYPGALSSGTTVPMDEDGAAVLRLLLDAGGAVSFGEGSDHPVHPILSERFGVAAQLSMAVFPKVGKPWQFGIHQCSHAKNWSPDERALFERIGWRLSDALTGLLMYRDLQTSEREFRTLAENLPDLLVRYDREGRRTYINPAMAWFFSITAEQMIGKTPWESNPTQMPMMETYRRALDHTLATGQRSEFELDMPNRVQTHLCFIAAERTADGQISGALAVSRDITERKRNEAELERHRHHLEQLVEDRTRALSIAKEAAEAATRAKTRFLAAASHDLRQPLQAIRLFSDILSRAAPDEEQKKIARYLSTSVNSLGELLDKLLDISKLDAGIMEPRPVVIEARDLLEVIRDEFDAVARQKNLRLDLSAPRRGLALFSDDKLLRTVLRNLVGNAIKYTPRGGVLLGIRRRGERALIQVWDTGIGIAPEQVESIFEEYFQIDNPERDRAKGVGLGLAIVKRLSRLLGIEVKLRSRAGRGSVFELSVPLASESDLCGEPAPNTANVPVGPSTRFAGKRIVVIEDDRTLSNALKLSLEMGKAHVTLFGSAEDALASPEAMEADYYVSDFRLPGTDGLQLLDAIQRRSRSPIKAVLLTGETAPCRIDLAKSSPWPLLFKPTDIPTLMETLDPH